MKIGIYGGTFDPPHLGHMEAARAALAQMNLDRLLIIPDREPPHKDLAEEAASPAAAGHGRPDGRRLGPPGRGL